MPPPVGQIELDEGTTSKLAFALRDALARNVDRSEGQRALERLHGRVLVCAEDRDRAVTIDVEESHIRIADGERPDARIRIVGDEEAILALTRVPFRGPVPEAWSPAGRTALKRQLGGELTIRGMVLRSPSVLRLLRLLAA